jgi:BclA C-terminal domain
MKKTITTLAAIASKYESLNTNLFCEYKKIFTSVGLIICLILTNFSGVLFAQNNSSAMLDVASTNKGVLIPRVALTSTADISTIVSPTTSLLVYNTATVGTPPNNVSPGYYYWAETKWSLLGSITTFAEFYALMPGDNTATIAAGAPVEFPRNGVTNGIITRIGTTQFKIPDVGIYLVHWQVSVAEAGQLILQLNGTDIASSVVGRATGTDQLVGHTMITTTLPNSILIVVNPSGNPAALTLNPSAGGTRAVTANLLITRIQ